MPIAIDYHPDAGYYIARYHGQLTDENLVSEWRRIFASPHWRWDLNELADLSDCDGTQVTMNGIMHLAAYCQGMLEKNGVTDMRTAVYAPSSLAFGLSRMYQALADESPETLAVFRDRDEAVAWLTAPDADAQG